MSRGSPTYPLDEVKALVATDACIITATAYDDMITMGLISDDVWAVVAALSVDTFDKTMPSEKQPSLMQDVYHPTYQKRHIYLKLQIITHVQTKAQILKVISFKRNDRFND